MDRCEQLASPSITQFGVSCFILVGLVVSYLPQHWRIISRRSSAGLSPYFVLLGTTAGTCALANILTLPTSRADVACCAVNDTFSCAAGLLGIVQITVQWSCFFLITFLFLIFIPRDEYYSMSPLRNGEAPRMDGNLKTASIVVSIAITHFVITFLVSIVMLAKYAELLQEWANILGVMAALLASTQYLPQIWTTWHLKEAGSLSIPMMLIQTPGGFLFAASLAARLGPNGWSAWAQYVVLAVLQGCLLCMAIIFEYKKRKDQYGQGEGRLSIFGFLNNCSAPDSAQGYDSQDEGGTNVEGQAGERSPLLQHDIRRSSAARGGIGYNTTSITARERLMRHASLPTSPTATSSVGTRLKRGSTDGPTRTYS